MLRGRPPLHVHNLFVEVAPAVCFKNYVIKLRCRASPDYWMSDMGLLFLDDFFFLFNILLNVLWFVLSDFGFSVERNAYHVL